MKLHANPHNRHQMAALARRRARFPDKVTMEPGLASGWLHTKAPWLINLGGHDARRAHERRVASRRSGALSRFQARKPGSWWRKPRP